MQLIDRRRQAHAAPRHLIGIRPKYSPVFSSVIGLLLALLTMPTQKEIERQRPSIGFTIFMAHLQTANRVPARFVVLQGNRHGNRTVAGASTGGRYRANSTPGCRRPSAYRRTRGLIEITIGLIARGGDSKIIPGTGGIGFIFCSGN